MTTPMSELPLTKDEIEGVGIWLQSCLGEGDISHCREKINELCDQALAALAYKSRAEVAEKDAARYRYLRNKGISNFDMGRLVWYLPRFTELNGMGLDKSIDAALETK